MSQRHIAGGATLLAALLSGTAAFADLTAEEVWKNWADYYAASGATISGEQQRDGDTLVIAGAKITTDVPDSSMTAEIGDVRLRETGDGKVEITFAERMPVTVTTKAPSGETTVTNLDIAQTGLMLTASGMAGNITYDMVAPDIRFTLGEVKVDGEVMPAKFEVALVNTTGSSNVTGVDLMSVTQAMKTEKVNFSAAVTDPENSGTFNMSGAYEGLDFKGSGSLPGGIDMADLNAAIAAGFAFDGGFSWTKGGYDLDFTDQTGSGTGKFSDAGGGFNVAMGKDGIVYGGSSKSLAAQMTVPDLPFPLEFGLAEAAFNFQAPVQKSDTAKPVALLVKMVDLTLADGIWGMFDPGNQLPRDPATLIVDLSGTGQLGFDLFDPALQAPDAPAPENPGTLESLNLNQLLVRAVGAELSGTGAVTFDNSGPAPMPLGSADLKLKGANGLIGKLVAMGFIPEDQAMVAQMSLGMFGVPSGEDELTSKIEFKEGGQITVNGAPLPPFFQ